MIVVAWRVTPLKRLHSPNEIWMESVVDFQLQSTLVAGILLLNILVILVIPFYIPYSNFLRFNLLLIHESEIMNICLQFAFWSLNV